MKTILKISLILLSVLFVGACTSPRSESAVAVSNMQADTAAMLRMAGIWVDAETEAVVFRVVGDSIFYPDSTSLPAHFAIYDDTLLVYSADSLRYPLHQVLDHSFVYENLAGELVRVQRSMNPEDTLFFSAKREYAPVLLNQLVKRDTVMYSPSGERYHLYIDVNPTRRKVFHTSYTDEGMAVENVYYDNIIHISVYQGRERLFSRDFNKSDFADFVPSQFLDEAILSNMLFGRLDKQGCSFHATLCHPDGASCYGVGILVSYDGGLSMHLLEY